MGQPIQTYRSENIELHLSTIELAVPIRTIPMGGQWGIIKIQLICPTITYSREIQLLARNEIKGQPGDHRMDLCYQTPVIQR